MLNATGLGLLYESPVGATMGAADHCYISPAASLVAGTK